MVRRIKYVGLLCGSIEASLLVRLATFPFSDIKRQSGTIVRVKFSYSSDDDCEGCIRPFTSKKLPRAFAMGYLTRLLRGHRINVLSVAERVSFGRVKYVSAERIQEINRILATIQSPL